MSCCSRHPTVGIKSAPSFAVTNLYITSGYRKPLPALETLSTLFSLHNETFNVWTHLCPALLFLFWSIFSLSQVVFATTAGRLLYSFACFGTVCMFSFSSIYHLFKNMSERSFKLLLSADFAGIIMIAVGLISCTTYYSFYCHKLIASLYISLLLGTASLSIGLMVFSEVFPSLKPLFHKVHTPSMVFIGILGFLTLLHFRLFVQRQLAESVPEYGDFFVEVCLGYFYYGFGLVFWYFRIPESLWLGYFDILFQSHQIWHIGVTIGTLQFHRIIVTFIEVTKDMKCT